MGSWQLLSFKADKKHRGSMEMVWFGYCSSVLINPTQSQAQEPADTFVQCGNVALTGSHPFIVGMDTVGMDTEREVTRCSLKTSRLNQPSLSFSSLKNLGLYLYAVFSVASSGRYSPYAGVSTLKQPSLPLPGMPLPGMTAPGFSSPALFPPGSTQPLNQRERVRPYLIPDNLSTDHIKKLNRAFRHIDQHGTEKPEKDAGVDIHTSFINHKVRQVVTLPEHCLTQERTFDLLNHLLEASLNAWLTYYLSISDTPSLTRLIPVFIERAIVMSSGAGGDDWNNGGWITNELNDDTPFLYSNSPFFTNRYPMDARVDHARYEAETQTNSPFVRPAACFCSVGQQGSGQNFTRQNHVD